MIEIVILMIVDSVYAVVMSGERGDGLYMRKWIYIYIMDKNINPIIWYMKVYSNNNSYYK
jgi:hypothetical protein